MEAGLAGTATPAGTPGAARGFQPLREMNRTNDLASRLARGEYEIDVDRVAEAMLRRRGRGLLMLVPTSLENSAGNGPEDDPGSGLSAA